MGWVMKVLKPFRYLLGLLIKSIVRGLIAMVLAAFGILWGMFELAETLWGAFVVIITILFFAFGMHKEGYNLLYFVIGFGGITVAIFIAHELLGTILFFVVDFLENVSWYTKPVPTEWGKDSYEKRLAKHMDRMNPTIVTAELLDENGCPIDSVQFETRCIGIKIED